MRTSVRGLYEERVRAGELDPDPVQRTLADELDDLASALAERARTSKRSALGWVFARGRRSAPPRGLYIFGGVGRGKTLLMDLFFDAAPDVGKRRVHFHAFMAEVHDRIAAFREKLRSGETIGDDPIAPVAEDIAQATRLLCFDEFAVNDIADAMILGRLFEQLFARGVTIVATSNAAPDDLYRGGLNRALFLPFIALLKERMATFHLDAPRDYRLDGDTSGPRYVTPLGPAAKAALDEEFRRLSPGAALAPVTLVSKGRRIVVPQAAGGVARFSFADLCSRPLAAADYLKIAARFHTVFVDGLPELDPSQRNEAKRLILLIDALYDNRIRLVVSAAAEPDLLWRGITAVEVSEFARTASRLVEMRSDAYWIEASMAVAKKKTARTVKPGR